MEDVLSLHARRCRASEPVVGLDERPVQLRRVTTVGADAPGRFAAPTTSTSGRGPPTSSASSSPRPAVVSRTPRRTARARPSPTRCTAWRGATTARRIHMIVDNLNTHRKKSLIDAFGPVAGGAVGAIQDPLHAEARELAQPRRDRGQPRLARMPRQPTHRSPSHPQVSGGRMARASGQSRKANPWTFTVKDARRVFRYDGIVTRRSKH